MYLLLQKKYVINIVIKACNLIVNRLRMNRKCWYLFDKAEICNQVKNLINSQHKTEKQTFKIPRYIL
jgi:hypothetical protein